LFCFVSCIVEGGGGGGEVFLVFFFAFNCLVGGGGGGGWGATCLLSLSSLRTVFEEGKLAVVSLMCYILSEIERNCKLEILK
jgi:hypothetical protein